MPGLDGLLEKETLLVLTAKDAPEPLDRVERLGVVQWLREYTRYQQEILLHIQLGAPSFY